MSTPKGDQHPKEKTVAQLWSRLQKLKERRAFKNEEFDANKAAFNIEIDAEIEQIKTTLGNVLSEE